MVTFKIALIVMMMGSSIPSPQIENIVDIKTAIIDKEIAPVAFTEKATETGYFVHMEEKKEAAAINDDETAATVNEIVKNNPTPEAVCNWMNKKVTYKTAAETWGTAGHWQTSEETLGLRAADCKGFAILAYECLKKLNVEDVKIVVLTSRHYGHAVVIFKKDGKWRMVSNGRLYSYVVEDYKDLFKVFVGYSNYQFCTPENHNILKI